MRVVDMSVAKAELKKILASQELGKSNHDRVKKLIYYVDDNRLYDNKELNLSKVLYQLYSKDDTSSLNNFRGFRNQLNNIAKELDMEFEFLVDTHKQKSPIDRVCYIEANPSESLLNIYTKQNLDSAFLDSMVEPQGEDMKPTIRYFIYHNDPKDIEKFEAGLSIELALSNQYEFEKLSPIQSTNEMPTKQLKKRLYEADFIIILLSKQLLSQKDDIAEFSKEIMNSNKRVFIIEYDDIDKKSHDMRHFTDYKPYRAKHGTYMSCKKGEKFFKNILIPIHDILSSPPKRINLIALFFDDKDRVDLDKAIDNIAVPISVDISSKNIDDIYSSKGKKIVDELYHWTNSSDSEPYCVLLGEYGMGKTVSTQLLAKRLIAQTHIETIYIDLRLIGKPSIDISLIQILQKAITNNHNNYIDTTITPQMIIDAVRTRGALIIFDGLDEVLTQDAERFIRELWSILPTALLAQKSHSVGKMLLSCRTHYFKSIADQNRMLLGEYREQMSGKSLYRGYLMLPFGDKEIRDYLTITFPDRDIDALLEMFASIHNVSELAKRPFNLWLISQVLSKIEQIHITGGRVEASTLYDELLDAWLYRDESKHRITPEHKITMMEHLAYHLWGSATREMKFAELVVWFDKFLLSNPQISQYYQNHGINAKIFQEDLRTATFIVRYKSENFSFAHTSIHEYFVAKYIVDELLRAEKFNSAHIALAQISDEVLGFVAQIIITADTQKSQQINQGLDKGFGSYYTHSSETLLRLYMILGSYEYIYTPAHIDMRGAMLDSMELRDIDMSGSDFSNASMLSTVFISCAIDGSKFIDADMRFVEFHDSTLNYSKFDSDMSGSIWRGCSLFGVEWGSSTMESAEFVACDSIKGLPNSLIYLDKPTTQIARSEDAILDIDRAHSSYVTSVAFNHDGTILATGSDDNSVILWDSHSGKKLKTLTAHSNWVTTVAFNHDGTILATGSYDESVILWDSHSGKKLKTLTAHSGYVTTVAFNHDGTILATGSNDKSVILWDSHSGKELLKLTAHSSTVTTVAFNHDGTMLATGSEDGSSMVWDIHREKEQMRLHHLGGGEYGSTADNSVIDSSLEAWRYLYYGESVDGRLHHFPVESVAK